MKIGRSNLCELHRHFLIKKTRKCGLKLRIGEKENLFSLKRLAMLLHRYARAFCKWQQDLLLMRFRDIKSIRCGLKPGKRTLSTEWKARRQMLGAPRLQQAQGFAEKGLRKQDISLRTHSSEIHAAATREEV